MPLTTSGKPKRLPARRKAKGETPSNKQHRFESFTTQIAKLSVNPVSRFRGRTDIDAQDTDHSTSHFRQSLDSWRDTNLSAHFSAFVREINPLCESLPQIVHHQDQIVDILLRYTAENNALSLEPLLSLISALAHDLKWRSESLFARTLKTITDLVSQNRQDADVLKWCFETLAWLFKYLEKCLVPDLRPTFDIMAPLLGNIQQKEYVARFAAEAMAFLVRKAAARHRKDPEPLDTLIAHVLTELSAAETSAMNVDTFEYGLMNLFAESIKTPTNPLRDSLENANQGLNSFGAIVFESLLQQVSDEAGTKLAVGTFVHLLHHTTATTSGPLFEVIERVAQSQSGKLSDRTAFLIADLIFHAATLRDGMRINKWESVVALIANLRTQTINADSRTVEKVSQAYVAILAKAPLQAVLARGRKLLPELIQNQDRHSTAALIALSQHLNPHRFEEMFRFGLQDYVNARVEADGDEVLLLLSHLSKHVSLAPYKLLSGDWVQSLMMNQTGSDLLSREQQIYRRSALLQMDGNVSQKFVSTLMDSFKVVMKNHPSSTATPETRFALGICLRTLLILRPSDVAGYTNEILSYDFMWETPYFLDNVNQLLKRTGLKNVDGDTLNVIRTSKVLPNLMASSSDLRKSSLDLLQTMTPELDESCIFFDNARTIEDTPIDVDAVRKIDNCTKKIYMQYSEKEGLPLLRELITMYLFGILTHQLPRVWPAALEGLKVICKHSEGEKRVASLVFEWLEKNAEATPEEGSINRKGAFQTTANEFQCIKSEEAKQVFSGLKDLYSHPNSQLEAQFEVSHPRIQATNSHAQTQALRVLNAIPWLAEKKSKIFVPWFLQKFSQPTSTSAAAGTIKPTIVNRNSRPERFLALDVLGAFQNPRVLFKSEEVYQALLKQLMSPEAEFQKRALKAILTWKQPGVIENESILNMIVDDARFREGTAELTKVFQPGSELPQNYQKVVPVVLRLLFGRLKTRSKHAKASQASKRRAVFAVLARFDDAHLSQFLEIALWPISLAQIGGNEGLTHLQMLPARRKIGLLNLIKDMVRFFGDRLGFLSQQLLQVALSCSSRSDFVDHSDMEIHPDPSTNLSVSGDEDSEISDIEESEEVIDREDPSNDENPAAGVQELRQTQHTSPESVSRVGLQTIVTIFRRLMSPELASKVPEIYELFINHKIEKLADETSFSVSNLLKLLSTWAGDQESQLFLRHSSTLLFNVVSILDVSPKEELQLFVLDQVVIPFYSGQLGKDRPLQSMSVSKSNESDALDVGRMIDHTFQSCLRLLQVDSSKRVQASVIELINSLAASVTEVDQKISLLRISTNLLSQPPSRVSPKTKSDVLGLISTLLASMDLAQQEELFEEVYQSISQLYSYFKDRNNRLKLCEILAILADQDFELSAPSEYCTGLNAFSLAEIDEPDFDRRREAYEAIIGLDQHELSARQWTPIIHNLIFYIKEADELGVGSNACFALCAFIRQAEDNASSLELLRSIILPAIRKGIHDSGEEVRREYLKVMSVIVEELPDFDESSDLRPLLMDNDEEANIFNNILHIQRHRRIRALHRLASASVSAQFRSSNVSQFLIPLIEHFIFEREDEDKSGDLAAAAVTTIGALVTTLEWAQARGLYLRYTRLVGTKPHLEKSILKLLGAMIDSIFTITSNKDTAAVVDQNEANGVVGEHGSNDKTWPHSTLARTLPDSEKLSADISNTLLPPLTSFLRSKDENVVSLRIATAVPAAKLMMLLPRPILAAKLPPMLTDVCHVLRSRTMESRDLCRKALAQITKIIGSSYFRFVLNELRGALQRGYQLHVLSYTMHTLLVDAGPVFEVGSLDHCLSQAVGVIIDDIFGATGMEKDAEGYTNKMKEVKQSKSFDSMELLAKLASLERLQDLLRPIQALLQEKLELKTARKVDDLLRRIAIGILNNPTAQDQKVLVFCYELIQATYATSEDPMKIDKKSSSKRISIELRGTRVDHKRTRSLFGFKIIRFAFDLVRQVVKKFDHLRTVHNLEGFMPVIGDAIADSEDEVQMAALRLLALVMKLPLKALEKDGTHYVSAAVNVIMNTPSNDTDLAQAAFKFIAATLKDRQDIEVADLDIANLLKRLQPDLKRYENPGFILNLMKSVVGRKYLIPEVYDVMNIIRDMMITSQSREIQNMARAVYLPFLANYPHSVEWQDRQYAFLGKNLLKYPQVDGRKSLLETTHRVLAKDGGVAQKAVCFVFEPLVYMMVLDDSPECRKMASVLIATCFEKAGDELSKMAERTREWLASDFTASEDGEIRVRAALQLYPIWTETHEDRVAALLPKLCQRVEHIIETAAAEQTNEHWAVTYYALRMLKKLLDDFPDRVLRKQQTSLWDKVLKCASYPHTWVKHAAAELIGHYLKDFADAGKSTPSAVIGSHGLQLEEVEMQYLVKRLLKTLRSTLLTTDLGELIIVDLALLAKLSRGKATHGKGDMEVDEANGMKDGDTDGEETKSAQTLVEVIVSHLSSIIRQEPASDKAASLVPRTTSLKLCHVLCTDLPVETLRPLLSEMLRLIQQIVESGNQIPFTFDEAFKSSWKDNVAIVHDMADTLQKRVGSQAYLQHMSAVQAETRARREERRTKRRIEAVAAPEKALSEKRRRHDRAKERRKEKNQTYRARRRGF